MDKTVALPMWLILMQCGQFTHWILNKHKTPKEQTGIPAGSPSLPLNGLTAILLVATGLTFAIWLCLAAPVLVLLLPFLPYTLFQLFVLPFVLLVVVPNCILLPIPHPQELSRISQWVLNEFE